jgi:hypothetical protein
MLILQGTGNREQGTEIRGQGAGGRERVATPVLSLFEAIAGVLRGFVFEAAARH